MRKLIKIGTFVLFSVIALTILSDTGTVFGERALITKVTLISPPLGTTLFEAKWDARVVNLSNKPVVATITFCDSTASCFTPTGLAGCSGQTLNPGESCDAQEVTTDSDETRYVKILLDGGTSSPKGLGSLTMVTVDGMTTVEAR
jgi:hypothetical protein